MLLMLAATFYIHLDHAAITLAQYGYCIMDTEMFETVADARIAEVSSIVQNLTSSNQLPISGDELLRALEGCSGSTWPLLSGSPIRRDGNKICVDLYGATTRLRSLIEFPHVQGQLANARADHFELAAQKIIDGSPWRPDENLRQVRGRTLRYANENVTDIDAIGVHGKTLLMVSCKSVVYSSAYDTGNYDTVRNTGGLIEKAVKYWRDKQAFIEEHRKGNNYDFTEYDRFIAVVCTPWTVYVPIGLATQEISPHLLAAVSLGELEDWLNRS